MGNPAQPAQSTLSWAAAQVGHGATATVVRGLREGANPWLLHIEHDGTIVDAVLKTVRDGQVDAFNTEIAAMRLAAEHGIAVPRIMGFDADGSAAGVRAVLETVVPGRSTIPVQPSTARLRAMGTATAAVNAIAAEPGPLLPIRTRPIPASDFSHDRRTGGDHTTPLLEYADEQIERLPRPEGKTVFVHADLWQGNLMWVGDTFSGMLDWEMAGVGHYGVDLGAMRLDAALMYGQDAAEPVLAGWEDAAGQRAEDLAYWDAIAAINQPGDMALFAPVMHDQGRTDLTAALLHQRRDTFLRSALDRLGLHKIPSA